MKEIKNYLKIMTWKKLVKEILLLFLISLILPLPIGLLLILFGGTFQYVMPFWYIFGIGLIFNFIIYPLYCISFHSMVTEYRDKIRSGLTYEAAWDRAYEKRPFNLPEWAKALIKKFAHKTLDFK